MVRAYAHLAALRAGEACDGLGEDVCARAEGPERDVVTGEGVAVPGREGLGDEVALVRAGIGEREVEEAGPGDADVGEARIVPQPLAQEGGEGERAGASGPGRDERDIAGVVPSPPGRGTPTVTRASTSAATESTSPAATARRSAPRTVRESSAGVTGPA
ncbi:hypothetical protein GA0115252_17961 [Streptomyces sp. DfronAA-171]|nr:hypothetical protein GA0115252_17961 [Streptomyces sp. DfronAA-171]